MNARARGALGVALVVLIASLGLLLWKATAIRVALCLRKIESPCYDYRKQVAAELWRLGPEGVAALEGLAFARGDHAPARDYAFDELWAHALAEPGITDDRLLEYLARSSGPRRLAVLEEVERRLHARRDPSAILTALGTILVDETVDADARAIAFIIFKDGSPAAVAVLTRGMLQARSVKARTFCMSLLERFYPEPEFVPPYLMGALGDSNEEERVAAATFLACEYAEPAGLEILVAATRRSASAETVAVAVRGLEALEDRRSVEALVRVREASRDEAVQTDAWHALSPLLGDTPATGETWRSLWQARRASFPPQLDPETIPVAPITSWCPPIGGAAASR